MPTLPPSYGLSGNCNTSRQPNVDQVQIKNEMRSEHQYIYLHIFKYIYTRISIRTYIIHTTAHLCMNTCIINVWSEKKKKK